MLRIFSKAGLSKDLYSKVYKTCSILISEDDTRPTLFCRSGSTFIDKMDQFIWRAQSVDNTPSDLNSEYSIKRCVQRPPSFHQPSKRLSKAAIKGGGIGLHDFYLMPKCCLFQYVFSLCWVDYAVEGSTFSLSKCDFSCLFHTERSWHTYRFTVVFVSGRQDLPSDARAFSLTSFEA